MHIFISYKSENRDIARQVQARLHAWGHTTWLDQDNIPKGGYFRDAIEEGLKTCDGMIGIVTPEALQSREVKFEWDYSFNHKKPFWTLYFRQADLPYHIVPLQYIDMMTDVEVGYAQLRQALQGNGIPLQPKENEQSVSTSLQDNNRSAMLNKVHKYWIEDVLHPILGEQGSLTINFQNTLNAVLNRREFDDYQFPENSLDIVKLFSDVQRDLLILGNPGSGKTILLLQLAERLIEEAQHDQSLPIPVLFNLSTWANQRLPLHEWLQYELHIKYQIPPRIAWKWLDNEQLLLLLDGLDEVMPEQQTECVEAINQYRKKYSSVNMAICSRIEEYQKLSKRLDVTTAITLHPLTDEQVQRYLADDAFETLRSAMAKQASLSELARVPFLLNTMAYVYKGANSIALSLKSDQSRIDHLLEQYVEKRLQESKLESSTAYAPSKSRDYLHWLAQMMLDRSETTFSIESLQPDVISGRDRLLFRILYGIILGIVGAIIGFGVATIPALSIPDNYVVALAFFVSTALCFALDDLDYQKQGWRTLRFILTYLMCFTLIRQPYPSGLTLGANAIVSFALPLSFSFQNLHHQRKWSTMWAIICGVLVTLCLLIITLIGYNLSLLFFDDVSFTLTEGFLFVLLISPMWMLMGGLQKSGIAITSRPNQRLIQILRISIFSTGFVAIFVVVLGLIGANFVERGASQTFVFVIAPLAWMMFGGAAVLEHIVTRIVLSKQNAIPQGRYDSFLDYAATKLHILRKSGGNYLFRHRYLLEYFAERDMK